MLDTLVLSAKRILQYVSDRTLYNKFIPFRNVLGNLSEEKRNSLLDELIYKISASEDISVGR